jgi:DNA-binding Xre family transcriptional regulator
MVFVFFSWIFLSNPVTTATLRKPKQNERQTAMIETVATTGEKLRRLRRGKAMNQEVLAAKAGISPSTVVEIENGKRKNPHPGTLGKLAEALEVSPADLLED